MAKGWTEVETNLVAKLAAEGYSAREIAEQVPGRSRSAVLGHCRWRGISLDLSQGSGKSVSGIERPPALPAPSEVTASAPPTPLPGGCARYTAKYLNPASLAPLPDGPTNGPAPWSDQEVARLRGMASSGYSGSEIASRLGRTREAVQAKCDRLDIQLKGVAGALGGAAAPMSVAPTIKALFAEPMPVSDDGKGCRFVEGGAYCRGPKHGRYSYCARHWPKVFQSQTPPPLKAMNRAAKPFSLGFST